MIEQTSFDSAAPSGTAAVVHKFDEPGEYQVAFLQDDVTIGQASLTVAAEVPHKSVPESITFDLKTIDTERDGASRLAERSRPAPSEWSCAVHRHGKTKGVRGRGGAAKRPKGGRFDTRRLEHGDLFAVTLLRPGHYRLVNTHGGAEGASECSTRSSATSRIDRQTR